MRPGAGSSVPGGVEIRIEAYDETKLREVHGLKVTFVIQVDTLCHKIPNFVEKAARAGCQQVFIGLENINPDSLKAARKGQNRITEYRAMLQAWRREVAASRRGEPHQIGEASLDGAMVLRLHQRIERAPGSTGYQDLATTPAAEGQESGLDLFQITPAARAAASKARASRARIAAARQGVVVRR